MTEQHLVFLTVPPPRSYTVVEYLADLPEVSEAAAVYAEIDVIAQIVGTSDEADRTVAKIRDLNPAITQARKTRIDGVRPGQSQKRGRFQGHSSVFAFVRCIVDKEAANFEFAIHRLLKIPEVRYLYPSEQESEMIVQVVTPDKIKLDDVIMRTIQGKSGVIRHTKTYPTINDIHWSDDGAPRMRAEYLQQSHPFPVFMGVASQDFDFGQQLADQIRRDSQIQVWHYGKIPPTTDGWPQAVDQIIERADAYLFLLSKEFIQSSECVREFEKVIARVGPDRVCCLLLPSCNIGDLPIRFQQRQCILGDRFFAYTQLLDWLRQTI